MSATSARSLTRPTRGARPSTPAARARLIAEFALLFVATPIAVALFLRTDLLFAVLLGLTVLGCALLQATPGFAWRELVSGWGRIDWRRMAVLGAIAGATALAVILLLRPEALFQLGRSRPGLLLAILLLYPVLSALPQEVLFRVLVFRRYGPVLPRGRSAQIVLSAALFSLAHLIYWSWVVTILTFVAGLVLAHTYRARRSFPEAVVLHAVGGGLLFTLGLGAWFYAGNATRPF